MSMHTAMRSAATPLFLALALAGCAPVSAPPGARASCPDDAADLPTRSLYGAWEARIDGQPGVARVELRRHPDYDGVRGTIQRAGQPPAQLAGDINPSDGQLALDESQDGRSISASWTGVMDAQSCGKRFSGNWHAATDDKDHAFTLDRVQGKQ